MKNTKTLAIGFAVLMLAAYGVRGETTEENHGRPGKKQLGELKAYRAKQKKLRREFKEKQMTENKAFHESLKDKEALEVLNAIIAHRKTQYSETKTFMDGLYKDFVSYAKEVMAKKEIPEDKQTKFLSKMEEHHSEGVAKHEEMHNKLIAALENLKSNENLTKEDIKNTMKKFRPKRNKGNGRGNKNND